MSYRVHVEAVDDTGSVVLTLFDEAAKLLLKKKASEILEETMNRKGAVIHITPRELLDPVGSNHILEVKTHTYFDKNSYVTFIVNKVIKPNVHVQTLSGQNKRVRDANTDTPDAPIAKALCFEHKETCAAGDADMEDESLSQSEAANQDDTGTNE